MMIRPRPAEANYTDRMRPIEELVIKISKDSRMPTVILKGNDVSTISNLELTFNANKAIEHSTDNQVMLTYFDNSKAPALITVGQSIGL